MPPSEIPYTTFIQNRSKKSVALNLDVPEARDALRRLVATADVFLTNSPRPVQEKLEHTYEDIRAVNPEIVYASVSGFGSLGPDRDAPGYDMTALYARSGLMEEMRPKGGDPAVLPASAGDLAAATALFGAIVTGLFHRERTGNGSRVATSLLSNGLWINSSMLQSTLAGAPPIVKYDRTEWPNPVVAGTYRTRDGRFIILVELNPANFDDVLVALGADHLRSDERFATPEGRHRNARELYDEIQRIVGGHDVAEISGMLRAGGVNFGVAQTTEEATRDDHLIANGCFPDVVGSDGIRTIDSPVHVEADRVSKVAPQRPPEIGEHTMSELTAVGYSTQDVEAMAAAQAVSIGRGPAEGV